MPSITNCRTFNNREHAQKTGGGLKEAFIDEGFAYASGSSGNALIEASFDRSLLFVESMRTSPNDEVRGRKGDDVQLYWHPSTESPIATVTQGERYLALINHHNVTKHKELELFFATPPKFVTKEKVPSALEKVKSRQTQDDAVTVDVPAGSFAMRLLHP